MYLHSVSNYKKGCIYQLSNQPIIQCVDTNQYCKSNESLRTLRVKDGMTFKVY